MTQEALSRLIECSRLLGYTQAKKALGTYTQQDSRFEVAMYKSIHEHEAKIKEALAKEKALQAMHNENARLGLYTDAYAQPEQEPVAWHTNSPSDPEICNERSAQACGPVYCGDSGGYCNKCPKQKIIQAVKPCKGMNCGCTDGRSHSLECLAELAAAIAGGVFVQKTLAQPEQEPVALREALASALTSVYVCGRVWSAWGVGTMSEDDFIPASECDEVLDALVSAVTTPPKRTEQEPDDIASILACRDMLDAQPVPQRTLAGLTDKEWHDLYEAHHDKYNIPKGSPDGMDYERAIEAKVRADEREACAKVAEDMDAMVLALLNVTRQPIAIAAAIRARGEQA